MFSKRSTILALIVAIVFAFATHVPIVYAATEVLLQNNTVKVSYESTSSFSTNTDGTQITLTVYNGMFSHNTATIKIYNNTSNKATLSFDYKISNQYTNFSLNASASGSYSVLLNSGTCLTFTLEGKNGYKIDDAELVISNLNLIPAAENATVTLGTYYTELGAATVGGGTSAEGSTETAVALVATPNGGTTFLGWINAVTGEIISTDATYSYYPAQDITVIPAFATASTDAWFSAGGGTYLFNDLSAAKNYAASAANKTIILAADGTLPAKDDPYEIPSGVTLLIPYDSENTLITNNMDSYISESSAVGTEYRKLTIASGANITVTGAISVGSQASRQMVGQVGPYGAIYMESDSNITIQSNGNLYAYGYIFHSSDGSGTVSIEKGGTVYETAFIKDYPGNSSNTQKIYEAGVFPMRAFTVRNVEVPMTLASGAIEKAFYSIYGTSIGTYPGYFNFIGDTSSYAFCLNSGATLTKSYSNGVQYLKLNGSTSVNSLSIKLEFGSLLFSDAVEVKSSETSGFPVPSGFDVTIESGTMTLGDNLIMMEGSKVTIAEGANVDTGDKNIHILDADDDPGAMWVDGESTNLLDASVDVHGTQYGYVDTDAVLEVNGTLTVSGGLYTSAGKASIISTGHGKVVLTNAATADTTVNIRYGRGYINEIKNGANIGYKAINVTAAFLKNANATYVSSTLSSAFIYDLPTGRWLCYDATNSAYAHPDTTGYCSDCGAYLGAESNLFSFYATNVNLGNNLDMLFAFPKNTNASYAVFTRADHEAVIVPSTEWETMKINGQECYVVAYSGFAAKEMCDTVYVHIYDSDNNRISECKNDGIRDYANRLLKKIASVGLDEHENLVRVIVDMLNYGAACQTHFNYKTTDPVNAVLTDTLKGYATQGNPTVTEGSTPTGFWAGSNLITDSNISLAILLKDVTEDATVTYSFTGHKGNTEPEAGKTVTLEKNGSYYYFTIPEVVVADARQEIQIKVTSGGTTQEWTESIQAYVARNAANDSVFIAFMKFADSARTYLHSKNS